MDEKEEKKLSFSDALSYAKGDVLEFREKLKTYSYEFNLLDENGKTILHHLCEVQNGSTDVPWFLLEFFADANIKDNSGNTPLHYAFKLENKPLILCLLLFGANPDILSDEDKKPIDLSKFTRDEFDPIIEKINKYKINFLHFTRKRRKKLRYLFEYIDNDSSKTIGEHKLKVFNESFNEGESEEDARADAKLFLEEARLFKSDEITFEEFILSMARISYNYNVSKIDEIINKFLKEKEKRKENNNY